MEKQIKLNTPLTTEEIDFRVQSVNKGGYATILAYKDARVDMNRLDAVYGVGFWQRKHEVINGKEFCSVGIWNRHLQQWTWVQDCGTESYSDKEKGQSSDAFKRACFNLGIGRELYDYPLIQIKLNELEFDKNTGKATFNFKLKEWTWISVFDEDGKLKLLTAVDEKGKERYSYGKHKGTKESVLPPLKILKTGTKAWTQLVSRVEKGETITKQELLKFFDLKEVEKELETLNIF